MWERNIKFFQFVSQDPNDEIKSALDNIKGERAAWLNEPIRYFHGIRVKSNVMAMIKEGVRSGISNGKNDFDIINRGFYLHVQGDKGLELAVNWAKSGFVLVFSFLEKEDEEWRNQNQNGNGINMQEDIPEYIRECVKENVQWDDLWRATITRYRCDRDTAREKHIECFQSNRRMNDFMDVLDRAPYIQGAIAMPSYNGRDRDWSSPTQKEGNPIQLCIKKDDLCGNFDMHLRAVMCFRENILPQNAQSQSPFTI